MFLFSVFHNVLKQGPETETESSIFITEIRTGFVSTFLSHVLCDCTNGVLETETAIEDTFSVSDPCDAAARDSYIWSFFDLWQWFLVRSYKKGSVGQLHSL